MVCDDSSCSPYFILNFTAKISLCSVSHLLTFDSRSLSFSSRFRETRLLISSDARSLSRSLSVCSVPRSFSRSLSLKFKRQLLQKLSSTKQLKDHAAKTVLFSSNNITDMQTQPFKYFPKMLKATKDKNDRTDSFLNKRNIFVSHKYCIFVSTNK